MPKDLHFAENMKHLLERSEFDIPKATPYKKCFLLMNKVHNQSLQAKKESDDEMEFFSLHRYLTLSSFIAKAKPDDKDQDFTSRRKKEKPRATRNLTRYEELQKILEARYEAREKASNLISNGNVTEHDKKIPDKSKKATKPVPSPLSVAAESGYIECNQLYSLLKNPTRKELLVIIDVRSAQDFKQSHLNFDNLLNIPEEIITSGLSADSLGKKLAGPETELWKKRKDADILVLMDWSTSKSSPRPHSKVFVLKNIIRQWDPLIHYKTSPLILEGGYEEVIERYPLITTNPKVQIPRSPSIASTDALSNLDYPIEDLEPERPKTTPPAPKPDPPPQEVRRSAPATVDRSTKPTIVNQKTQVNDENIESLIDELADSFGEEADVVSNDPTEDTNRAEEAETSEPLKSDGMDFVDSSSDTEPPSDSTMAPPVSKKPDPAQVENLRKLKPFIGNNERPIVPPSGDKGPSMDGDRPQNSNKSRSATSNNENGVSHEPLKRDGSSSGIMRRSFSSPNIKEISDDEQLSNHIPSFSRSNKPSTPKVQHYLYNEKADSVHGKTFSADGWDGKFYADFNMVHTEKRRHLIWFRKLLEIRQIIGKYKRAPGLTGLKNFANNCYMNSILQCLNNTEPLVSELLRLQVNPSAKKGRIAQEVIAAFRSMWSEEIKVYSIRELKSLMGDLKDIFKGSMHQDSNEFLIILLEHLHEDLNVPAEVENLVGAVEETGEKAWGEFRRKNCSIIQQLFYGQHKSTVTCSTCGHNSATFEQFFNLFVPIPSGQYSVTLNDCIQSYMSGERINGWKCPNCKVERTATKKFDISRLPPVLIIALKRFTQEDGSWLHKKENLVSYPLDNMDMSRFTVPGSEQRYKSYDLYAMSTHSGTLQSGHYRAICKSPWNKKWYMFDDQSVDLLTVSSVQSNPEVYILFYIAKQPS